MIKTIIITIISSIVFLGCFGFNQPKKVLKTQTSIVFPKEQFILNEPKSDNIFEKRANYLPPVISHNTFNYTINLDQNNCTTCHNMEKNQNLLSHYNKTTLKPSYRNCLSCHPTR